MKVGDLCQHRVVTLGSGTGLTSAARVMRQEHVGYLVVVEPTAGGEVRKDVGVLTDRDIVVAVVAREADPRGLTVDDVMTRDPLVVNENSSLESALTFMQRVGVRRVPVLGSTGALMGVLVLDEVLKVIALQLNKIAGCIGTEQRVERCVRS